MTVHYAGRWHTGGTNFRWLPACGARPYYIITTSRAPLVTCGSCKRTVRYRNRTPPGP